METPLRKGTICVNDSIKSPKLAAGKFTNRNHGKSDPNIDTYRAAYCRQSVHMQTIQCGVSASSANFQPRSKVGLLLIFSSDGTPLKLL